MRQRAAESDVVIVNHHLLCADAAVRQSAYGEVIPSCPTLVVDEAHQLEDVATQYFGCSFSNYRVDDLVRDGERLSSGSVPRKWRRHRSGAGTASPTLARFSSGLALDPSLTASAALDDARPLHGREPCRAFEDGMMLAGA